MYKVVIKGVILGNMLWDYSCNIMIFAFLTALMVSLFLVVKHVQMKSNVLQII